MILKTASATRLRRAALHEARNGVSHFELRAPYSWTTSAFSGHQMGGQERQLTPTTGRPAGGNLRRGRNGSPGADQRDRPSLRAVPTGMEAVKDKKVDNTNAKHATQTR